MDVREIEVLRAGILQEIYTEIENLPDKCGHILKMSFPEELPNEMIAIRLGLNVQTIRSRKRRAIGLIRSAS